MDRKSSRQTRKTNEKPPKTPKHPEVLQYACLGMKCTYKCWSWRRMSFHLRSCHKYGMYSAKGKMKESQQKASRMEAHQTNANKSRTKKKKKTQNTNSTAFSGAMSGRVASSSGNAFACLGKKCSFKSQTWNTMCDHLRTCNIYRQFSAKGKMNQCKEKASKSRTKRVHQKPESTSSNKRQGSKPPDKPKTTLEAKAFACLGEDCPFRSRKWNQMCNHLRKCKVYGEVATKGKMKKCRAKALQTKTAEKKPVNLSSKKPHQPHATNRTSCDDNVAKRTTTLPTSGFACLGEDCSFTSQTWDTMCKHLHACQLYGKYSAKGKMEKCRIKASSLGKTHGRKTSQSHESMTMDCGKVGEEEVEILKQVEVWRKVEKENMIRRQTETGQLEIDTPGLLSGYFE